MSDLAPAAGGHAALMDAVYRRQRHVYDATRRYFLFGRDTLIEGLGCPPGAAVLEIACGTGRNLHRIGQRWPGSALHGLDISREMLASAEARLGGRAILARGDAAGFDPEALFGRAQFDRVVLSFALSMIPRWHDAIGQGLAVLAPGGALHVVDFGDFCGLPRPARAGLDAWLGRFHVTRLLELGDYAARLAASNGHGCELLPGPLGYFHRLTLRREP